MADNPTGQPLTQIAEINPLEFPGWGLTPAFANRTNVSAGPQIFRFAFGETLGTPGGETAYHTVIVMTPADAVNLAQLILRSHEQVQAGLVGAKKDAP